MDHPSPSPLDVLETTFQSLAQPPRPLSLDGRTLPKAFPRRLIPLDELRALLLHPSTPWVARDAAMAEMVRRAQDADAAWRVGLGGVLLPGLRRIAGNLARDYAGDPADIDAEVLVGLLSALDGFDPAGGRVAARLLAGAWRQGRRLKRGEERAHSGRHVPAAVSAAPAEPFGHPDLVLARAVADEVISAEGAELIAATRLEGAHLATLAADAGVAYDTLKRKRWRAECRLRRWLDPKSCR